jgi:hypothetical protein
MSFAFLNLNFLNINNIYLFIRISMFSFLSLQQNAPGGHRSDFSLSSDGRTVTDVLHVHKILDKVASDYTLVIKNSIQTLFPLPPPHTNLAGTSATRHRLAATADTSTSIKKENTLSLFAYILEPHGASKRPNN